MHPLGSPALPSPPLPDCPWPCLETSVCLTVLGSLWLTVAQSVRRRHQVHSQSVSQSVRAPELHSESLSQSQPWSRTVRGDFPRSGRESGRGRGPPHPGQTPASTASSTGTTLWSWSASLDSKVTDTQHSSVRLRSSNINILF